MSYELNPIKYNFYLLNKSVNDGNDNDGNESDSVEDKEDILDNYRKFRKSSSSEAKYNQFNEIWEVANGVRSVAVIGGYDVISMNADLLHNIVLFCMEKKVQVLGLIDNSGELDFFGYTDNLVGIVGHDNDDNFIHNKYFLVFYLPQNFMEAMKLIMVRIDAFYLRNFEKNGGYDVNGNYIDVIDKLDKKYKCCPISYLFGKLLGYSLDDIIEVMIKEIIFSNEYRGDVLSSADFQKKKRAILENVKVWDNMITNLKINGIEDLKKKIAKYGFVDVLHLEVINITDFFPNSAFLKNIQNEFYESIEEENSEESYEEESCEEESCEEESCEEGEEL